MYMYIYICIYIYINIHIRVYIHIHITIYVGNRSSIDTTVSVNLSISGDFFASASDNIPSGVIKHSLREHHPFISIYCIGCYR